MMGYRGKRLAAAMAGLGLTVLAGCDSPEATAPVVLSSDEAVLYEHSCKTCHEEPATGAPPSHDLTAWAPRIAKGEDKLLENIVNGFNGMPPLGQCIECSAEDFIVLTRFMASPSADKENGGTNE